jgi:hypothetical protein
MAYFNHAFHKVFLGNANVTTDPTPPAFSASVAAGTGFIDTPGVATSALSEPGVKPGYFGVFDAKTYLSIAPSATYSPCCPFIIASSPIFTNDKIGPFAGGYRESNKSKMINPRYVRQFYYVAPCVPQQSVVSIGTTVGMTNGPVGDNYATACEALDDDFLNANNFQGGTTCNYCCKEFLCGETYYLRIDIKGSPALRFLNHQAYQTVSAYTGCCSGPAPTPVDPTLVYIEWAKAIYINPYIKDLVFPVVFDTVGGAWYPPNTTLGPQGEAVLPTQWWTAYDTADWDGTACTAGLRLFGAYVETKFGNCTFQVTDFFEKEPVKILASEVDYTGDPCTFSGLCVYTECYGVQGMGFGEQVLRDLIISESYLQNYVGSGQDFRIREITQGYDTINSIDRNSANTLYGRYYLLHSVPRFNNPTGVFDNDQYMLEIITSIDPTVVPLPTGQIDAFEDVMGFLLGDNCADCVELGDPIECTACDVVPNVAPLVP